MTTRNTRRPAKPAVTLSNQQSDASRDELTMFALDDIAGLIQAAGKKPKARHDDRGRSLDERLNEVAHAFVVNHVWQNIPSSSKIINHLRKINAAAKRLSAALSNNNDDLKRQARYRLTAQAAIAVSTPELTDLASGTERLNHASSAVREIEAWSRNAIARESKRVTRRRPVPIIKDGQQIGYVKPATKAHKGNQAMQSLIGDLCGVWIDFWEQRPTATVDPSGEVSGKFILFSREFLHTVTSNLQRSNAPIDKRLLHALKASPDAIRERLRIVMGESTRKKI